MNFQEMYRQKLTTPEEAVKVIRSGDWVDYGWSTGTPDVLDKALAARAEELTNVKIRGAILLRRPAIDLASLGELAPELTGYAADAALEAELSVKYEGYLKKQQEQIARARAMEDWVIPDDIDYNAIESLRIEARQKLSAMRPRSLSQAGRIPGVNPADVAVLMVYLRRG